MLLSNREKDLLADGSGLLRVEAGDVVYEMGLNLEGGRRDADCGHGAAWVAER